LLGETVSLAVAATGETVTRTITSATSSAIQFAAVTGLANADTFTFDTDWCWITSGTPATNYGEVVARPDYYNGSMVRIYDADMYEGDEKEVIDYAYDSVDGLWHFKLRHQFENVPTSAKYEIMPLLPSGLDDLYAIDVAMRHLGRRTRRGARRELKEARHDLWQACVRWVTSNTADRAPERIVKPDKNEVDPYDYQTVY
jgi:hypothetical protein